MRSGDIVIVLFAGILIGAACAWIWQPTAAATEVIIRAPGQAPRYVDLDENQRLDIDGRYGESIVLIEAGRARFMQSPCPAQYCVHRGWLDHAGDFAACLPNGVSLTLVGGADHFDAIAY